MIECYIVVDGHLATFVEHVGTHAIYYFVKLRADEVAELSLSSLCYYWVIIFFKLPLSLRRVGTVCCSSKHRFASDHGINIYYLNNYPAEKLDSYMERCLFALLLRSYKYITSFLQSASSERFFVSNYTTWWGRLVRIAVPCQVRVVNFHYKA